MVFFLQLALGFYKRSHILEVNCSKPQTQHNFWHHIEGASKSKYCNFFKLLKFMYNDERMLITKSEYTEGTSNTILVHCTSIITSSYDLLFLKFTCPINNVNASSSFSCLYLPLFYVSTLILFTEYITSKVPTNGLVPQERKVDGYVLLRSCRKLVSVITDFFLY